MKVRYPKSIDFANTKVFEEADSAKDLSMLKIGSIRGGDFLNLTQGSTKSSSTLGPGQGIRIWLSGIWSSGYPAGRLGGRCWRCWMKLVLYLWSQRGLQWALARARSSSIGSMVGSGQGGQGAGYIENWPWRAGGRLYRGRQDGEWARRAKGSLYRGRQERSSQGRQGARYIGRWGHTNTWLSQGAWWSAYHFIHFCWSSVPRIDCLDFRKVLIALFPNPDSWSSSHDSWLNFQQTKKQYNTRATHFTEIVYLKQKQEDMMC